MGVGTQQLHCLVLHSVPRWLATIDGQQVGLLKKYPDGCSADAVPFRALNQLNLKTSQARCIQEKVTQYWSYSYRGAAKR